MEAAADAPSAPWRVIERRLKLTEQRFEEWRSLMAITIGTCMNSLVLIVEATLLLYVIDYDPPYRVLGTQVIVLIGVTWGLSQLRPAYIFLGVAANMLFLATLVEATLFSPADPRDILTRQEGLSPTVLDVIAAAAGCIVVFAPVLLIAFRVVRSTTGERAIIALPQHRTFGFVSAVQALFGAHPICLHLPSRGRRILAIGLFGLSQLVLGLIVALTIGTAAKLMLAVTRVLEGRMPTLLPDVQIHPIIYLIGVVVVPLIVFGVDLGWLVGLRYWARRFSRTSLELMVRDDSRAPILFLRSFSDDQVRLERPKRGPLAFLVLLGEPRPTLDHVLLEEGTELGPVIAIGAPGSRPPFGAARAYISDDNWKQVVSNLARSSQAIVMALDETAGIEWEVKEVHGNQYAAKILHLLPPRLAPAAEARRVVAKMRANLPEVADLFGDLQRFLDANVRPCVGWYFRHDGELVVLTTERPSEASYRMSVRDYFRSTEVKLPAKPAHQDTSKPQRLGVAAFAIAAVALAFDFLLNAIATASDRGGASSVIESSRIFDYAHALPWILGTVAVAAGIAGLFVRRSEKIFPILGIVIGAWLLGSAALVR